MVTDIASLVVYAGALGLAALSPGPGVAALVATVMAKGTRRASWLSAGIILGDLVWLGLSLSGLVFIASAFAYLFIAIKWVGVCYLIYLAVRLWQSPAALPQSDIKAREDSVFPMLLTGISITLSNPKAILFYLALLPSLVDPSRLSYASVIMMAFVTIVVLGVVFSFYILAAAEARRMITTQRSIRTFNRLTALSLSGAAAWIASR